MKRKSLVIAIRFAGLWSIFASACVTQRHQIGAMTGLWLGVGEGVVLRVVARNPAGVRIGDSVAIFFGLPLRAHGSLDDFVPRETTFRECWPPSEHLCQNSFVANDSTVLPLVHGFERAVIRIAGDTMTWITGSRTATFLRIAEGDIGPPPPRALKGAAALTRTAKIVLATRSRDSLAQSTTQMLLNLLGNGSETDEVRDFAYSFLSRHALLPVQNPHDPFLLMQLPRALNAQVGTSWQVTPVIAVDRQSRLLIGTRDSLVVVCGSAGESCDVTRIEGALARTIGPVRPTTRVSVLLAWDGQGEVRTPKGLAEALSAFGDRVVLQVAVTERQWIGTVGDASPICLSILAHQASSSHSQWNSGRHT